MGIKIKSGGIGNIELSTNEIKAINTEWKKTYQGYEDLIKSPESELSRIIEFLKKYLKFETNELKNKKICRKGFSLLQSSCVGAWHIKRRSVVIEILIHLKCPFELIVYFLIAVVSTNKLESS